MTVPHRHDYHHFQDAELAKWPGVTFRREHKRKHYALVLTFKGRERFVVYPTSPGDRKGHLAHITCVRAELAFLGAVRAPAKSEVKLETT